MDRQEGLIGKAYPFLPGNQMARIRDMRSGPVLGRERNTMRILISIDDTDDIDSRGTGEIAELLAHGIEQNGWGKCGPVTRHQLFIHPDIPYTSHNSSMCFPAEIPEALIETVTGFCSSKLSAESAPSSDPGLCVLVPERLQRPEILVSYGRRTKTTVITKEEAYATAASLRVHLSEHGGTGQGVIGALAGAALRLTGNDGRFKGKFRIPTQNGTTTVGDISAYGVDMVQAIGGDALEKSEKVHVGEWVKLALIDGKAVLLAVPALDIPGVAWKAADRKVFKDY